MNRQSPESFHDKCTDTIAYKHIILLVSHGLIDSCCKKNILVTAGDGEKLNISCRYPDQHRKSPKFFCKEIGETECRYKQDQSRNKKPNPIKLYEEHGLLIVSFSNLIKYDSGHYWCGVEVNWGTGGYKVYITKVSLNVTGNVNFFFSVEAFTVLIE